jgi:hypothetical protein
MKRINPHCDQALGFLIEHKDTVTAEHFSGEELAPAWHRLSSDGELLQGVVDVMDRKDHELRLLSVRLPPYNYIMKRGLEKIGNMTIQVSFLDELRRLSTDEVSERLNSPDAAVRVRPAADMRCLICLVDHAIKRTPFRKELRLLRIRQSIEEFYRTAPDVQEARRQAESFLNRRLRRLFPNLSPEETGEIRQLGMGIIDDIEKRILAEAEARQREAEQQQEAAVEGEELELSDDEKRMGVQIGRVEMRVAGSYRRIPYKIMPDPDEPEAYVIAQRDPESGQLVPQRRRGAKRLVERGKDGVWRPL